MYLSTFSILLPLLLGAVFFQSLTRPLRILYVFIAVSAILETWTITLNIFGMNNLMLFNLFTFIEFAFLSIVFRMLFPYKYQRAFVTIVSFAVVIYFVSTFSMNDLTVFNSKNRTIESAVFIGYGLMYIVTSLNRLKVPYLELNPYFILTSGLLIYFAGTIFVFVVERRLNESNFMPAWTIHSILNMFLNVIFASVIWRSKRTSST